ncbi:hypothetical protein G6011_09396 [Alternaria panax]|uniref:Uncharacterized protein n=1 Tax=Alternaria panax TaxID=48097 RepID=A0AAD4IB73_9PLEO|nr:hypothetical protein G6011_09396 [Alternaria panax]
MLLTPPPRSVLNRTNQSLYQPRLVLITPSYNHPEIASKPLAQKLAAGQANKTPTASPTAASSILTNAFVTFHGSNVRLKEADVKAVDACKIYPLSFGDRKLLSKGPKVQIIDHEGSFITDMPIALFRATSTKEMVAGTLGSPSRESSSLPQTSIISRDLHSYRATYWDLQLCSAADFLGMNVYTQHLFNWYWARLSSSYLPDYADIDAISAIQTPVGDTFFRKVMNGMAKLDHERQTPYPQDFEAYSKSNGRFGLAVEEAKKKMQKHQACVNKNNRMDAEAEHQEEADKLMYQQRQKQLKQKAATWQAKWDVQKKKDAELAARVKAKMTEPGKKKWRPDEAAYLRRVRGMNVTSC